MEKLSWRALAVVGFLLIGVFIAGCSDNAAPATGVTVAPTQSSTLYSAGDIVKNPASSADVGLLIIGYDPATDMYERAYIYPNNDGSWGYRIDTRTDSISRSVIEQVYTTKVGTITVSSVPIGTPVATATTIAASATTAKTATTSTTATTTTTTGPSPRVKNIEPDKGKTGTTVSITDLEGQYFQSGANVSLKKSKESPLIFTNVVVTSTKITGKVTIPPGTELGYWNVVVTNPDGKSDIYETAFLVQQGTSSGTTTSTTTTTVAANAPTITDIDPDFIPANQYTKMFIYGTNFRNGITGKLTKEYKADIIASTCVVESSTKAYCFFDFPAGSQGSWNLVVRNTDGTTVTKSNVFTVNS